MTFYSVKNITRCLAECQSCIFPTIGVFSLTCIDRTSVWSWGEKWQMHYWWKAMYSRCDDRHIRWNIKVHSCSGHMHKRLPKSPKPSKVSIQKLAYSVCREDRLWETWYLIHQLTQTDFLSSLESNLKVHFYYRRPFQTHEIRINHNIK